MVLVDVIKSLEDHFFGGIPVVSCHLWNDKGITVSHPQYRCHIWYVSCLLQVYIFRWFWWVICVTRCDCCMSYTNETGSRHLRLPGASSSLGTWCERIPGWDGPEGGNKRVLPRHPKAMFVAFFKAFWFELKHDCGRKDGWWLVHSKVFVWCFTLFWRRSFVWNPLDD